MNKDYLSNIIIRISSCSNYPETITENLILYIQNNYEEQEVKKLETISNILANINTSLNQLYNMQINKHSERIPRWQSD